MQDQQAFTNDLAVPSPDVGRLSELNSEVGTRYEMLAGAMSAFLNDDMRTAFARFNETAYHYVLDEYLPYFAFSASVTGHSSHLHAALERRQNHFKRSRAYERNNDDYVGIRFDEDLTYGVLAAFDGSHDDAIDHLKRALNDRPYVQLRTVFPYYQVVDLADRLFERTGDVAYRDFALDLARRHTIIQPMYAWAYFVVAKYSDSEVERVEAAASGFHLDPLSHRGSALPAELRDQSEEYLINNAPPYLTRSPDDIQFGT
jgi:hypothetical protein